MTQKGKTLEGDCSGVRAVAPLPSQHSLEVCVLCYVNVYVVSLAFQMLTGSPLPWSSFTWTLSTPFSPPPSDLDSVKAAGKYWLGRDLGVLSQIKESITSAQLPFAVDLVPTTGPSVTSELLDHCLVCDPESQALNANCLIFSLDLLFVD